MTGATASPLPQEPLRGPLSEQVSCARHPDVAAIGTCERCGDFRCGDCTRVIQGRYYCGPCVPLLRPPRRPLPIGALVLAGCVGLVLLAGVGSVVFLVVVKAFD